VIDADLVGSAKLAFFDGYVLDFPDAEAIVERLVAATQATGTLLAFGLSASLVVDRHRAVIERLVSGPVRLLFANEDEAITLTGEADAHKAASALAGNGMVAVITRGAEGALVATSDHLVEVAADPVTEVVDATGAGFCFGVARGLGLERAGRLGALAAGEVIGHLGARPERSLAGLAVARGLLGG